MIPVYLSPDDLARLSHSGCEVSVTEASRVLSVLPEAHGGLSTMDTVFLEAIKKFEGFTPTAKWDYAQYTNGYGTKANFPGETITRDEADRRFRAHVAQARAIVERVAPHVDEGTTAALTSLTFNTGTRWINSGLGDAVRRNDLDAVREIFVKYVKAGGETLNGLVKRRHTEVAWIGAGAANATQASTPAASAPAGRGASVAGISPVAVSTPDPASQYQIAAAETKPAEFKIADMQSDGRSALRPTTMPQQDIEPSSPPAATTQQATTAEALANEHWAQLVLAQLSTGDKEEDGTTRHDTLANGLLSAGVREALAKSQLG